MNRLTVLKAAKSVSAAGNGKSPNVEMITATIASIGSDTVDINWFGGSNMVINGCYVLGSYLPVVNDVVQVAHVQSDMGSAWFVLGTMQPNFTNTALFTFRAHQATAQSFPSGGSLWIDFDTIDWNPSGAAWNYQGGWSCPVTGYYDVKAAIKWAVSPTSASAGNSNLWIQKTNEQYYCMNTHNFGTGYTLASQFVAGTVYAQAGDQIGAPAYQSSGNTLNTAEYEPFGDTYLNIDFLHY